MRGVALTLVCLSLWISAIGCGGYTKTVIVEERVARPAQEPTAQPSEAAVVRRTETVKTRHEPRGVLSTTLHIVGEIVALPFRLISWLIEAVF